MSPDQDLTHPDLFTVGTNGPVGQRTFLVHVRESRRALTVKVEKGQVALLSSYLARIVREVGRPGHLPEELDFDTSADPEWVVGTIGVSYDSDLDRLIVVLEEISDDDDEGEGNGDDVAVARVAVTREQAAAFAIRATSLVEAGRPPCPLCGLPLDPSGHACPRTNGHRPPVT